MDNIREESQEAVYKYWKIFDFILSFILEFLYFRRICSFLLCLERVRVFFHCFFNGLIMLCHSISLFIGILIVSTHSNLFIWVANSTVEYSAFKCG